MIHARDRLRSPMASPQLGTVTAPGASGRAVGETPLPQVPHDDSMGVMDHREAFRHLHRFHFGFRLLSRRPPLYFSTPAPSRFFRRLLYHSDKRHQENSAHGSDRDRFPAHGSILRSIPASTWSRSPHRQLISKRPTWSRDQLKEEAPYGSCRHPGRLEFRPPREMRGRAEDRAPGLRPQAPGAFRWPRRPRSRCWTHRGCAPGSRFGAPGRHRRIPWSPSFPDDGAGLFQPQDGGGVGGASARISTPPMVFIPAV